MWKRLLVRNASPSPANIRVGSSFSRLNANTPAVKGKLPGTFSVSCQRRISPSSSYLGSATLGTWVPERETVVSAERISLPRIFTTYSSPVYEALVFGHISRSFLARGSNAASRSAINLSSFSSLPLVPPSLSFPLAPPTSSIVAPSPRAICPSFPRKRESSGFASVVTPLGPRFREDDDEG